MPTANEPSVAQISELVARLNDLPDPESRNTARSLIEAVLSLHGAGIQRMLETLFDSGDTGKASIRQFAADPLISSLLVLHDLHPDDLETRVRRALGKLHGAADIVSVFDGSVRLRLNTNSCGVRESVEAAVHEEAPDAVEIIIEDSAATAPNNFVPLAALGCIATPVEEHA